MKALVLLAFMFAGCSSVGLKCNRSCYTTLGNRSVTECTLRKMACSKPKPPPFNKWAEVE
jgi:hypothetical protein